MLWRRNSGMHQMQNRNCVNSWWYSVLQEGRPRLMHNKLPSWLLRRSYRSYMRSLSSYLWNLWHLSHWLYQLRELSWYRLLPTHRCCLLWDLPWKVLWWNCQCINQPLQRLWYQMPGMLRLDCWWMYILPYWRSYSLLPRIWDHQLYCSPLPGWPILWCHLEFVSFVRLKLQNM